MAKNTAHESLDRVRDKPIAKIELSASRFISAGNPLGFGHPHYSRLGAEGFSCLRLHWQQAANAGYKIAAMWEPKGREPGDGAMAWVTEQGLQRCWTEAMKLSWQVELAIIREMGMDVMWYLGVAPDHLDTIIEDLAFVARMGVRIVGLDYFSALILENPARAEAVITSIRKDKRIKHLTLITEGALPVELKGPKRAFFLRHMAQLELARGSRKTLAINDTNWDRVTGAPADRKLIKGSVHIMEMHGSEWKPGDIEACYDKIKMLGLVPCDYRVPLGAWK